MRLDWLHFNARQERFDMRFIDQFVLRYELPRSLAKALTVLNLFMTTRLCDLDHRSYVELMYFLLGQDHVRSHTATMYVLKPQGFFEFFNGIFPEATMKFTSDLLLMTEGLVRVVPGGKSINAIVQFAFEQYSLKHGYNFKSF